MTVPDECTSAFYPPYSLVAALICESGQTWGFSHFINPFHLMITTQNGLFTWFLASLTEVLEVLIRWWTLGPDGKGDYGKGLADYESPAGSLLYDELIQCGWGIVAGTLWTFAIHGHLPRPAYLTKASATSFGIFILTIFLQIGGAQLEPDHHAAAVWVVGLIAAIGGSLNLYYLWLHSVKKNLPPQSASIRYQIVAYWLIVFLVSLGDAHPDRRLTYILLFMSQGLVTVLLGIAAGVRIMRSLNSTPQPNFQLQYYR
jgi:hypothetical protein